MQKTCITDLTNWFDSMVQAEGGRAKAPNFVKPYHLASLAVKARKAGKNIQLPPGSDIEKYACRLGLWDAIGQERPVQVNEKPPAGRFISSRVVENDNQVHQISLDVSEMFQATGSDKDTCDSLQILISELLGNCCAHSGNGDPIFGIITGQVWRGGNLAQICIADCGTGIRKSLSNNKDLQNRLDTENACEMATQYGVTGKPFGHHSGYGLTLTNDLISQNNGCLVLLSGNEYFVNCEGRINSGTLNTPWDGTIIVFEWNIDTPLNVNDVYNAWPTSDAVEEEDIYGDLFG